MKIMAINGSPRKKNNTAAILLKVLEGAASEGSTIKMVNLFEHTYSGCISCFACKRINGPSYGKCVVSDDLKSILHAITVSDGLIIGSPVYFGQLPGALMSFYERFLFAQFQYDPQNYSLFEQKLETAFVYTMNVPAENMEPYGYPDSFNGYQKLCDRLTGNASETLFVNNTYQFDDYGKYYMKMFKEEDKRKYRDEHFPIDCENAFQLGVDMAQKIKTWKQED